MGLPNQGAQAPFFIPDIAKQLIPKQRFDSLLEQAISAFQREDYAQALLFAEIVCRSLPADPYPALLRVKIIEQLYPALSLKAGYLAWKCNPATALMQDTLLQQWHQAGAKSATQNLATLFAAQRLSQRQAGPLKAVLKDVGAELILACWRYDTDLVVEFEFFAQTQLHDYHLCLSSDTAVYRYELSQSHQQIRFNNLPTDVAWSVSLQHKTQAKQFIASGSPLRLQANTCALGDELSSGTEEVVILIPVYQGYQQVVACISSVLASLASNTCRAQILVIDDAGNEPALSSWLQQLAEARQIQLIRNALNLGFIETVNRGLLAAAGKHVMLLNSDTQVSGNWLDQLLQSLQQDPCIASVSSWSNNGEISSFPVISKALAAPDTQQLSELQRQIGLAANELALSDHEVPVCCGFAMLMRSQAIQQVGLLDGFHLQRGYAEEVDWCLRANELGFKHVLNPRVFIAHHGSSSFKFEKYYRVTQNLRYIHTRYPGYRQSYQRFVAQDGLRKPRKQLIHRLMQQGNLWLRTVQEGSSSTEVTIPRLTPEIGSDNGGWVVVWQSSIAAGVQEIIRKISYALLSLPHPQPKLLIVGEAIENAWASGNCYVLPKVHSDENNLLDDSQLIDGLAIKFLLVNDVGQFPRDDRILQLDHHFNLPNFLAELRKGQERELAIQH